MQGCCSGCSGSCLPLGGVRVLSSMLSRVLRIMFAIGRCQGAVQGAVRPGCCQGAPDHVSHWAVSPGCCAGVLNRVFRIMFATGRCHQGAVQGCCSGVLSKVLRIMFAMVLSRVLSSGAVQGAPDHVCYWAVSRCGCC